MKAVKSYVFSDWTSGNVDMHLLQLLLLDQIHIWSKPIVGTEVQPLFQSNVYQIHLGGVNIAGKKFLIIDTNLTACRTVQEDSRTQTNTK